MDPKEVMRRVEEIRKIADEGDDEAAHSEEDQLHRDVLEYIGTYPNGRNNGTMARMALETTEVGFARWYA